MKQNLYKTVDKTKGDWRNYKTGWNIYPKILKLIRLKKEDKILDAGCGRGELAKYLPRFELYGIDLFEEAIEKAKQRGYKEVLKNEIYNIKFEDKEFDKTLCIQVFQYLEDSDKAFKELKRVTRKEIIISVPNFNWLKIKALFGIHRKTYRYCIKYENYTDSNFLRKLAKQNNTNIEIKYLSNKLNKIRNLLGDFLASEVVGIYKLK